MLEPEAAASRCDLLIDVAQAGDFGVFRSRRAARIAFAISAHVDPATSPFPRPAPQVEEGLYRALLDALPRLLADVDEYRSRWGPEDAALTNTQHLFDAGRVTIEEQPELDLAVVRGRRPASGIRWRCTPARRPPGCCWSTARAWSSATATRAGSRWPRVGRALRVDLTALAGELTREDGADGRWRFEGVEHITPRMYREGGASILTPEDIRRRLEAALRAGAPAWNPYG